MDPETATERTAVTVLALEGAGTAGLTVRQVAAMTGVTRFGAWRMLCRMSRVIPLYHDDDAGVWVLNLRQ